MDENNLQRFKTNGVFTESYQTDSTTQIPLNVFLSFPFFWKSSKIFAFFRDSWNCIKNQDTVKELNDFKDNLKKDYKHVFMTDWISILGEEHWAILQKDGSNSNTPDKIWVRDSSGNSQNVVQLLRLIRNKAEHPEKLGKEERRTLGWFPDDEFDQHAFVTYWIKKFPKLLPFLWLKFYQFKDRSTLCEYYTSSLDHYDNLYFDWKKETVIEDVIDQFLESLKNHLFEVGLVKRYLFKPNPSIGKKSAEITLEFITLSSETLSRLLDGSSSIKIEVNNDIKFTWYSSCTPAFNNESTLTYSSSTVSTIKNFSDEGNITSIVAASNINDKNVIEKITGSRVVFLINEHCAKDITTIQSVAHKLANINQIGFDENPICWSEIPFSIRSKIFNESHVKIQNKFVKLCSILPKTFDEDASTILSSLKESTLNELLTKGQPVLFEKVKMPQLPTAYIERRLRSFREVSSKILRHDSADIIIVTNITAEQLKPMTNSNSKFAVIQNIHDQFLESSLKNCRIFLLENYDFQMVNILQTFRRLQPKDDKNIHCIRYLREEIFQWLVTHGSLSLINKSFVKKPSEVVIVAENDFIMNVENENSGLISIADKPGMGKSLLLNSLAIKVAENFKNSFVVLLNMNDFASKLHEKLEVNKQKHCRKLDIVNEMQVLLCTTEFEQNLVGNWLQQSCHKENIIFELMLDGLDEVEKKYKNLAINVLEIIHKEIPVVRLWVTLREYMQADIEKKFSIVGYKIQPFSEDDKVRFLQNYWSMKLDGYTGEQDSALRKLALKCLRQTNTDMNASEIAGAPLQCRMLAEVYENSLPAILSSESSTVENICLTKLYEKMVDKHLKIYLEVKKGVQKPDDMMIKMYRDKMELWHIYLAFKLLFPDLLTDSFCVLFEVTSKSKKDMESFVKEQGLVESFNPIRFVHRTFAEYFIALFTYKVLTGKFDELNNHDIATFATFFSTQLFDVSKWQYNYDPRIRSSKSCSKFKYTVLCYFLNSMLEDAHDTQISLNLQGSLTQIYDFSPRLQEFECDKSVILATLHHNFFNLAHILLESLNLHDRNNFLKTIKDSHEFFLDVAIRDASSPFFIYIYSLIEEWHINNENIFEISTDVFKKALTKGKYSIVKFLVENKGFGPEKWNNIYMNSTKRHGVIHHIIAKSRHDSEQVLEEKKKLLEYLVQKDRRTLELQDVEGRTPILLRSITVSFVLKEYLVQLGANVNATGVYGNTEFHWQDYDTYVKAIPPEQYHKMLEKFLTSGFEKINAVSNSGCTPIHCAVKTYSDMLQKETLELFQIAGADFNRKDKDGRTVLHICIEMNCNVEFIEILIGFGCNIEEKNSLGQTVLILAIEKGNFACMKMLIEKYGACLTVCDNEGKSAVEYATESSVDEIKNYKTDKWNLEVS